MNILEYYLKSKVKNNSQGFTLIELLVAIAMASVIMVGLGTGLVALLSNSNTSAAKNDLKDQLNRAADYINEDLKRTRIANVETKDINGDGTTEKVLILTYFNNIKDTTPKTISYYLADASNPWRGPKVLMRLHDDANATTNDTAQVLVDSLTENTISSTQFACNTVVANGYHASTTTATTAGATFTGTGGFQACIQKKNSVNGAPSYSTNIALFGEISDLAGTNGSSEVLSVDTDTISRSLTPTLDAPVISFDALTTTYDLTPGLDWDVVLGALSYNIYKCETTNTSIACDPDPAGTDGGVLLGTSDGDTPLYAVTTEPATGNRACFAVEAINGNIKSEFSNRVCTIINPAAAPTAISDLSAVDPEDLTTIATTNDIYQPALKWGRDTSAYEYKVYRCQTAVNTATCTVDTSNSANLISTFVATTDTEFEEYVPWYQANNGDQTVPDDNKAFCYKVIATNSKGSTGSNTACGDIKVSKTFKNNWTPTWGTVPSGIKPQNMTWTGADTSMLYYEVARCTTTAATCDPSTDTSSVLINNNTSKTFSETSNPADGYRFCYAIRGSNDTQIGGFNATKCGDVEPLKCTLNLADFGLGASPETSTTGKRATNTESKRLALISKVTASGFSASNVSTVNINDISFSGVEWLYSIYADSGTTASGSADADVTISASVTIPCDRKIKLNWNYFTTTTKIAAPTGISINTSTNVVSWSASSSAGNWTNPMTYIVKRCTVTSGSSCSPTVELGKVTNGTTSYTTLAKDKPAKNTTYCYNVQATVQDAILTSQSPYSSSDSTSTCVKH